MSNSNQEQVNILQRLEEIQNSYGYVSVQAIKELSDSLHVTESDIYGILTFYSFLSVKPQGTYIIRVCKSLPCFLKNYETIVKAIQKEIGIKPGETTGDNRFSLQLTNCIGACDKAPAMMINNDLHVHLTPKKIAGILRDYK
jgi:NADH-quinone oxidoreductase E subunit